MLPIRRWTPNIVFAQHIAMKESRARIAIRFRLSVIAARALIILPSPVSSLVVVLGLPGRSSSMVTRPCTKDATLVNKVNCIRP